MSKKNIEDIYPLSPMQAGMLFHSLRAEDASLYFVQLAVTVEGELDIPAFQKAFQATVDQHPMLRTGFARRGLDPDTAVAELGKTVPLGRIAEPEDIADVILFLASDAARYMAGALVEVNGGKPVK